MWHRVVAQILIIYLGENELNPCLALECLLAIKIDHVKEKL